MIRTRPVDGLEFAIDHLIEWCYGVGKYPYGDWRRT